MKHPSLQDRVAALEKQLVQLTVRGVPEAHTELPLSDSGASLEERVAALEKQVLQLLAWLPPGPQLSDWRSTIGMFANDAIMKQIDTEGTKIREADRKRRRRPQKRTDKKKTRHQQGNR